MTCRLFWPFNMVADLDFIPQMIEETEETILQRDGNGALLRRHKLHDSTPEHVDFLVKDRKGWEEHIKPLLTADRRRINFEAYREAKQHAGRKRTFFLLVRGECIRIDAPCLRARIHADGHGPRSGLGARYGRYLFPPDHRTAGNPICRRRLPRWHLVLRGYGLQTAPLHVAAHVPRDHPARPYPDHCLGTHAQACR